MSKDRDKSTYSVNGRISKIRDNLLRERKHVLPGDIMSDYEFATLLLDRMREIARAVFQEAAHDFIGQPRFTDGAPAKLREQIALIKAKERITVKEAALLLSCSESHIRKLIKLARKGKSRRPIPFVDMEGVTVFPLCELSEWASPEP